MLPRHQLSAHERYLEQPGHLVLLQKLRCLICRHAANPVVLLQPSFQRLQVVRQLLTCALASAPRARPPENSFMKVQCAMWYVSMLIRPHLGWAMLL